MYNVNIENDMFIFHVDQKMVVLKDSLEAIRRETQQALKNNQSDIRNLQISCQIAYIYDYDYKLALKIIKQILEIDSRNIDALVDLVGVLKQYSLKPLGECFNLLEQCQGMNSKYWRIHVLKSMIYDLKGKDNIAFYNMKQLAEAEPNNPYVLSFLSQFYRKRDEVLKLHKRVEEQKIYDHQILRRLSYSSLFADNKELCKKLLLKSLILNPKSSDSLENYSYFMRVFEKDQKRAEELLLQSLKNDENNIIIKSQLGLINNENRNFVEAAKYYKDCVQTDRYKSVDHYSKLGLIYYEELSNTSLAYYYIQKPCQFFKNDDYLNTTSYMQRAENPFFDLYPQDLELDEQNINLQLNNSYHEREENHNYYYMQSQHVFIYN